MVILEGHDCVNVASAFASPGGVVRSALAGGNFWICSEHTGHPLNGLDGKLCSGIKVIVSGVFLGRRLNERAPNSSSQILVSGLRMICDDVFTVQQGNKLVKENCFSLSVFFF